MQPKANACLELGSGALERGVVRAIGRSCKCRVRDAPVHEVWVCWKLGTHLSDAVAKRDHVIEVLRRELVQMLGTLRADVDPSLPHDPNRIRVQLLGIGARASTSDRPRRQL